MGSNAFSRQQFSDWHFEKCQTAVNATGLINVLFTDLRLTDIPGSGGIGAIFNGQNYTLTAAQLTNSSISLSGSGVNLDGCIIDNSQVSVFSTNNTSVIKTSTFRNDAFLDIHTSAIQVNNNRFESESYLKVTGGLGGTLNPVIRNNVMDGGNPVSLKAITLEFASPEITNNTIAYYRNSIDVIGTADPVVKHNIFYQNEFNPPLNGTFKYNNFYDISNDNVPNGGGNIEIDPFFVDPANGDFRLIWGSPMIDAGDPAEPFDSDGTIADIGALFYDQTPITMAVNHPSGWDLVSLPVGSDPVYYLDMFPLAITNTLFSYNGAYQLEDSLQLGTGYWLNLSQSGSSNPVAGIDITALALDLTAGWQFIPGISSSVPVGSIIDPANILNSIFGWNGAYVSVTSLEPGKAYWVNALASGRIVLAANSGPLQKSGDPAIADLDSANWMRFTNNAGNEFTVFFGIDIDSAGQRVFSLPPVPLDSVLNSDGLDVRFTGNFYAADTSGIIEVRTAAYPLTVEYQIEDSTDWNFTMILPKAAANTPGKPATHNTRLSHSGILAIEQPVETLVLRKAGHGAWQNLPGEFVLHQNYPNPFNPVTEIRYALPEKSDVKLSVYNMLGQKIRTLIDREQAAGFYSIRWDATNDQKQKVASGIYLYRISAGKYTAVKKLILLK